MLTAVFPAFNEAESLRRFPREVVPVFDSLGIPYEIVIVDDGSRDETAEVARSLAPPVRLVQHERNQGLGAALRTGFAAAKGDLLVTLDSDLTFAPTLVRDLLVRFDKGDVDVVSGSPKLASFDKDIPAWRIFVSKIATGIYSLLLRQKVTSVTPILRLYRTADLRELHLTANGFEINAEILFALIRNGKKVAEVPAPLTQRLEGESKLNYRREMQHHCKLLARILAWSLSSRRSA